MGPLLHVLPYLVAAWIFCCGLYGVVTSRNYVHLVMCLAVLQTSTYALLLGIGYKSGGVAPIFQHMAPAPNAVDPVVQAMMLTDVVVEATVMALLLALATQAYQRAGTVDPDRLGVIRG